MQAEARLQYRLDKFRARRARKRWLHQEFKVARSCHYHGCDCNIYSNISRLTYLPQHPYMPTTTACSRSEDDDSGREYSDLEQVTGNVSKTNVFTGRSGYLLTAGTYFMPTDSTDVLTIKFRRS